MDRASASEAGNVGSTPAGRKLKNLAFARLFIEAGSRQTALPVSGGEGRSDVFVWGQAVLFSPKGKNREARPEGFLRQ